MIREPKSNRPIDPQKLPPVSPMKHAVTAAGAYGIVPIDKNNSFYSEELVDLCDYGISGSSYYYISDGTNPPYFRKLEGSIPGLLARKSVVELLQKVNLRLASSGLELFVWDAYRPLETQIGIWELLRANCKANKTRAK